MAMTDNPKHNLDDLRNDIPKGNSFNKNVNSYIRSFKTIQFLLDDIKDKSDDNDVKDVNICNKINLKKYKYSEDEIKILMQRFKIETYNLKTLFRHFQHKCRKLNQSKSILELKYKKYK